MKDATITLSLSMAEIQNDLIRDTFRKEQDRLFAFIRSRVPSTEDAEDVLQDVFYELVNTYRLMKPVEQMASWMFTVARNKITDRFRKKKPESLEGYFAIREEDGERLDIADFLPSGGTSQDREMMREVIMDALTAALAELPEEQRNVFVMHEFEDKSFNEIAEIVGAPINTLLSRKRYAVMHLRKRMQHLYEDMFVNQ
jgi:RNA polymerase sigma factor (sigma-70 family)